MTHILRVKTGSSFSVDIFPEYRPRELLSTLNSRQSMEGRMLSSGESIHYHFVK